MVGFVFVPSEINKSKKWAKKSFMGSNWFFNTEKCSDGKLRNLYSGDSKKKYSKYEEEWLHLIYQTSDTKSFSAFFKSLESALSSSNEKQLLDLVFVDPKQEEDGEWYEQLNGPKPFINRPHSLPNDFVEELKECVRLKEIVGFDPNFHYRGKNKVCSFTDYPGKLMIQSVSYPECHLDGIPEGYEKPIPN